MDGLYDQTLHHLNKAFKKLEATVPPPQKVARGDGFVYRYKEETIQQAMIQKLARVVSGLYTARSLLEMGMFKSKVQCTEC